MDCLLVGLTLTATTHSGRNDATHLFTGLGPVGVYESQGDAIGPANGNDPMLAVVATCVGALQGRPVEHLRGELEVEAPHSEIAIAFPSVPPEAHALSIRAYIRRCNGVVGLTQRRSAASRAHPTRRVVSQDVVEIR